MKLRIQDNSLRLRLTQKEVALLGDRGSVDSAIHFPGARVLHYGVTARPDTDRISVRYEGDSVCVCLPANLVGKWAKNNETTIEGADGSVQIVVEKDFRCLHRPEMAEPDAFPNPLA